MTTRFAPVRVHGTSAITSMWPACLALWGGPSCRLSWRCGGSGGNRGQTDEWLSLWIRNRRAVAVAGTAQRSGRRRIENVTHEIG
jgi:hypothetical protein